MVNQSSRAALPGKAGSVVVAFTLLLLLAQCASVSTPSPTPKDAQTGGDAARSEVQSLNRQILASAGSPLQLEDYVIAEGDLLSVKVFEAPELATKARVSAKGRIILPLLGEIEVKGMTLHDAGNRIANAYKAEYLQDPHVSILIEEQQGGKVTVAGAVEKPGTYNYYSHMRILDVLAMAGGISENAGQTIQVRRRSPEPKEGSILIIDLDQLVKNNRSDLNITLDRGDAVFVPQTGVVYVDGAVRTPGHYPIKRAMSVREAIVSAGGFHSTASKDDIKLIRYVENGKREVIQLSGKNNEGDSDINIEVMDRDLVFVESNALASILYGLQTHFGLVGFGYTPPAR